MNSCFNRIVPAYDLVQTSFLRTARLATRTRKDSVGIMKLGSTPFLATEVRGDTAWVGLLYVPVDMRRHGLGRALFERWMGTIPPDVRRIRLFSVNLDGDYPTGFWKKLGFEIEGEFSETEIATCYMSRPRDTAGGIIPRSCNADGRVSPESSEAAA